MKVTINYQELSKLTGEKFTFSGVSASEVKVSGEIKILVLTKQISTILKIERVGYSSIDFSSSDPELIGLGLKFLPKNLVCPLESGNFKVDLKAIPSLKGITGTLKIDSIKFESTEIIIKISPRP